MYTALATNFKRFLIPDASLHLANMRRAQKEHTKARLTYTSTYGKGQFSLKKAAMEGEIFSFLKTSFTKLI